MEDDQTLPAQVGQNTVSYVPYNYAMHGHGPFDSLASIENINYEQEIKEKDGILIYVFIEPHIARAIGSMKTMSWKADDVYYEQTKEGKLLRKGTFRKQRRFLTPLYIFLNKSRILKALRIDFPLKFNASHFSLTADVIKAMKEKFQLQYPHGEFYLMIFPGSLYSKEMIEEFKKRKIDYLDYTHLYPADDPRYVIAPQDEHPSPLGFQFIAKKLISDLGLK